MGTLWGGGAEPLFDGAAGGVLRKGARSVGRGGGAGGTGVVVVVVVVRERAGVDSEGSGARDSHPLAIACRSSLLSGGRREGRSRVAEDGGRWWRGSMKVKWKRRNSGIYKSGTESTVCVCVCVSVVIGNVLSWYLQFVLRTDTEINAPNYKPINQLMSNAPQLYSIVLFIVVVIPLPWWV